MKIVGTESYVAYRRRPKGDDLQLFAGNREVQQACAEDCGKCTAVAMAGDVKLHVRILLQLICQLIAHDVSVGIRSEEK